MGDDESRELNLARTVLLASYPRSGVTYLRHVIERMYGIPTFTMHSNEPTDKIGTAVESRTWHDDSASSDAPVLFAKTHSIAAAGLAVRAIHLVRDGRDVVVSYAHYLRDIVGLEEELPELMRRIVSEPETLGYMGTLHHLWPVHTLAWLARPAARIWFDDLIARPREVVAAAVGAVAPGLRCNMEADLRDWGDLHAETPKFWRSGKSGQWKDALPRELLDMFSASAASVWPSLGRVFAK